MARLLAYSSWLPWSNIVQVRRAWTLIAREAGRGTTRARASIESPGRASLTETAKVVGRNVHTRRAVRNAVRSAPTTSVSAIRHSARPKR